MRARLVRPHARRSIFGFALAIATILASLALLPAGPASAATTCAATQYTAEYFPNTTLNGTPTVTRCEDSINYSYGNGSPTGVAVGPDNFSIRWTETTTFVAGVYTFTTTSDDGIRVLLDGTPVINHFVTQAPTTYIATPTLTAGTHTIVVEYFEATGGAQAQFSWTPPGVVAAHVNFQPANAPVPAGYIPDTGAAYDPALGRGWIRQDSIGATPVPLNVSLNTRDRNRPGIDQRLDTMIHMQYGNVTGPNPANGNLTAAAWEYAVPNGQYRVTVSSGDQPGTATASCANPCYDSVHNVRVEGVTAIDHFRATAATEYASATVTVSVSDGKLTIDALGGTNTKLDYVDIAAVGTDTTPPAAPTALTAQGGTGSVALSWTAPTDSDLAGYYVYRSTSSPVFTGGSALNLVALTSPSYADTTVVNGTQYFYAVVAVDASGNRSTASPEATATPQAPSGGFNALVNFQDATTVPPSGYVRDSGEPYGTRTGANQGSGYTYGWVATGTHTPISLVGNGRNRDVVGNGTATPANEPDLRLATFIHMQLTSSAAAGNMAVGDWELAVPNGAYQVTVSVGEAGPAMDSSHWLNVENQNAIAAFVPTGAGKYASATRTVVVSDGRLTISPTGGTNTKIDYVDVHSIAIGNHPYIATPNPGNLATGVTPTDSLVSDLSLPAGGVDASTLSNSTVMVHTVAGNTLVPGSIKTSGGHDTVNWSPTPDAPLAPLTLYRLDVTSGVQDVAGHAFLPFSMVFTTGSTSTGGGPGGGTTFTKVGAVATGAQYTSLVKGPDGKLYAGSLNGYVYRWTINADGTLSNQQVITTVRNHATSAGLTGALANRTVLGMAFDPASTASNLILWITDNPQFLGTGDQLPDFSDSVATLSGPDLGTYTEILKHLPRSIADHETNSLGFGPDGALYLTQGANSAMGAPDTTWGLRAEHLLTAAVLRVDRTLLPATLPLDVQTVDAGGPYDPYAAGAPLTIYASGVRNAFDFVWHSNGHLYVPTNGSAAGGNTPATPSPLPDACSTRRVDLGPNGAYTGPSVPAINNSSQAETDFVYDVKRGRYYGHPNASRCEWVLDNGNPTSAADPFQFDAYPVGTQPDRNYDLADAYDAGDHASADGAIEYMNADAFAGALKGKLLVVRYSDGQDVESFDVAANGTLSNRTTGVRGLTGFSGPLDIVEDPANGNVYVSELTGADIQLARPSSGATPPHIQTTDRLLFTAVAGGPASATQSVVIRNTGGAPLTIPAGGLTLTGPAADHFTITAPSLPTSVPAGGTLNVPVTFAPTATGVLVASLSVTSDDPATPTTLVALRGLAAAGSAPADEPSLQRILDLWQVPVDVGDPDPSSAAFPSTDPLGDEVDLQTFVKADSDKAVVVDPLAVFAPGTADPLARFGWHPAGDSSSRHDQFTVSAADAQSVTVSPTGATTFDPGPGSFALYSTWPDAGTYAVSTQDSQNTFDATMQHHVRVYPYKTAGGTLVPNTYVMATETGTSAYDFQDLVVVVHNIRAVPPPGHDSALAVTNLDPVPYPDRMVFSRINTPVDANQRFHDTGQVRISNPGTDPLQVTGLPLTGPFALVSAPSLPLTVPAGGQVDLTVQFTATTGDVSTGTLTVQSDAGNGAASKVVQLAGFRQTLSENNQEPSVGQIDQIMGYTMNIPANLNAAGRVAAVGDEIIAPYWQRADSSAPVTITQLAAYRTQNTTATIFSYPKGSTTTTTLMTAAGTWGQSLLPVKNGTTSTLARTTITPTGSIGFKVDGEWSDPALNDHTVDVSNGCAEPCGQHVRFFPIKDRNGVVVPGSYLLLMDYSGINYDYNDNEYLIENVRPDQFSAPTGVTAVGADQKVTVSWNAIADGALTGYRVFRSTTSSVDTGGTPISGGSLLTATSYVDNGVTNGTTYYYSVVASYTGGNVSTPSTVVSATPASAAAFSLKVNFQSATAPVPAGYVRDFGQSYGPRTAASQGSGMTYGWVVPDTHTPLDLSIGGNIPGNGRDRNLESDQRFDTFIHMQANNISGAFNGTKQPGGWELALPNGSYSVTVAVGDGALNDLTRDPEIHRINVEGVNAIAGFVPTGAAGAATRHTTATITVTVSDGRLTIDANGGTNTKIDYVDIRGLG